MMRLVIEPARAEDLEAVERLLGEVGLPVAGVRDGFPGGYAVTRDGGAIVGVAGLEVYDRLGLLRSVAVAPSHRDRGIARRLVEERVRAARERGLERVLLLTTTAAEWFRRLGFRDAPRSEASAQMLASQQFVALCPASAACLVRDVA